MKTFLFNDIKKHMPIRFVLHLVDLDAAFKVAAAIDFGSLHTSEIEVYEIGNIGQSPIEWVNCTPGKAGEIFK